MRALLNLGRDLGLAVLLEGVEDEGRAAVLHRLGCPSAQGCLHGRPVPATAPTAAGSTGARRTTWAH